MNVVVKNAHKMMTQIEVDKKGERVHVRFADDVSGTIPFSDIAVVKDHPVELDWDLLKLSGPYYFTVPITSDTTAIVGQKEPLLDVPWDFVRDACDPEFKAQVTEREHLSRLSLGKKIQELRKAQGFTQETLAKLAGINRVTLADLERGGERNPRLQTLRNIAKVLDVDLVEMLKTQSG